MFVCCQKIKNHHSSTKLTSPSEPPSEIDPEPPLIELRRILRYTSTYSTPQVIGSISSAMLRYSICAAVFKNWYTLTNKQQEVNISAKTGQARNKLHLLVLSLKVWNSSHKMARKQTRLGSMKVMPQITQFSAYVDVIIFQHLISLVVSLTYSITIRKVPSASDGMQVNTTFLSTKCTKSKYLPGVRACRQTSLVMKMIQKLAATRNAIRPMMLISQRCVLSSLRQASNSKQAYRPSLMSRIVSTCMM